MYSCLNFYMPEHHEQICQTHEAAQDECCTAETKMVVCYNYITSALMLLSSKALLSIPYCSKCDMHLNKLTPKFLVSSFFFSSNSQSACIAGSDEDPRAAAKRNTAAPPPLAHCLHQPHPTTTIHWAPNPPSNPRNGPFSHQLPWQSAFAQQADRDRPTCSTPCQVV